jgi:hypothetical protein
MIGSEWYGRKGIDKATSCATVPCTVVNIEFDEQFLSHHLSGAGFAERQAIYD